MTRQSAYRVTVNNSEYSDKHDAADNIKNSIYKFEGGVRLDRVYASASEEHHVFIILLSIPSDMTLTDEQIRSHIKDETNSVRSIADADGDFDPESDHVQDKYDKIGD